jgi:hypothetical protein
MKRKMEELEPELGRLLKRLRLGRRSLETVAEIASAVRLRNSGC